MTIFIIVIIITTDSNAFTHQSQPRTTLCAWRIEQVEWRYILISYLSLWSYLTQLLIWVFSVTDLESVSN